MQTLHVPLIEKKEIARDTYSFVFPKPAHFQYHAGQYVSLSVQPPEQAAPEGTMRELSLVSAPFETTLEVALRFRDSRAKQQFLTLEPGDHAYIQGPFGAFHVNPGTAPVVLLAGGIGIAPFVSIMKQAAYDRIPRQFYLFYSNRSHADIAYLPEMQQIAQKNDRLTVITTLTAEKRDDHEVGYISTALMRSYLPSVKDASFYISGPQRFVGGMWEILTKLGIPDTAIHGEEFTGYE